MHVHVFEQIKAWLSHTIHIACYINYYSQFTPLQLAIAVNKISYIASYIVAI